MAEQEDKLGLADAQSAALPRLDTAAVSRVADHEGVYRAILYPHWWPDGISRPSSAAFDEEVFSVDVKSRTTPHDEIHYPT